MNKSFTYLVLVLSALLMVACGDEPTMSNDISCPAISGSFPRKHVIEHFTGATCGYCPSGMEALQEGLKGHESDYIWISNHYGYQADSYTVSGSSTVGKLLGINGAPEMVLDRSKITGQSSLIVDPRDFPSLVNKIKNNTSFASVELKTSYDATDRTLSLHVSGECENADIHCLKLTVLVKESGMVGAQADYDNSWAGWTQFRHTKTIRKYVSEALGDSVSIRKGKYAADYTIAISDKWKEDSCTVVAFLTWPEGNKPIINANQAPVVEGTTGGEDIVAAGITMKAVADQYTETSSVTPAASIRFSEMYASPMEGKEGWVAVSLKSDTSIYLTSGQNRYECFPFVTLELNTGSTELVNGTYAINDSGELYTAAAGHHSKNEVSFYGTMLYYIYRPYWTQYQMLYDLADYPVASGEVIIDEQNITFSFTTYRGNHISGTCPRK